MDKEKPTLIEGAGAYDDRGSVKFINGFNFKGKSRLNSTNPKDPDEIESLMQKA